jgi:NADH:ubiquinone oxidoreductase subunit 5 (subunit L)/multisubunit Na+/H+ antiporter MnhA subunit
MQTIFILSELFARLAPVCALIASLVVYQERRKLQFLLFGQVGASLIGIVGLVLFFVTNQYSIHGTPAYSVVMQTDFLATVMAVSINFISSIVVWFSERNLIGDKTRVPFVQYLVALAAVASFLVAANNLIVFLLCWHAVSILLWRVISLKKEGAASAKVVLHHHLFSDACFALATLLILRAVHYANLSYLACHVSELQKPLILFGHVAPVYTGTAIGILLVLAMMSKSALFPFHRWLLATIDAPTPLSGLLHAGIVNVSAIMAARFFAMLTISPEVEVFWFLWAAFCAMIGTVLMSARSDTKGELVFSTVGQMGFMSLQCAVGAVPAAVFHLIAHGFFKCMLFLQAHSSISEGLVKMRFGHAEGGVSEERSKAYLGLLAVLAVPVCFWLLREGTLDSTVSLSVIITTVALASTVQAFKRVTLGRLIAAAVLYLLAVMASGFISESFTTYMPSSAVHHDGYLTLGIIVFALISLVLSWIRGSSAGRILYVHALNGLYVDDLLDSIKIQLTKISWIFSKERTRHEQLRRGATESI